MSKRGNGEELRSPEEFIVPAKDTKGESSRLWCRIQPAHDRQLDIVVNSKKFPFRTRGDVVRWALSKALKELDRLEPVGSMIHEVDAANELLKSEQFRQEFVHTFTHLNTVVQQHMADHSPNEARRVIVRMRRHFERMDDGHWKRKYLETLESKFGHIVEEGKGAGLKQFARGSKTNGHGHVKGKVTPQRFAVLPGKRLDRAGQRH